VNPRKAKVLLLLLLFPFIGRLFFYVLKLLKMLLLSINFMSHGPCPVGMRDYYFINCLARKNCQYGISRLIGVIFAIGYSIFISSLSLSFSRCPGLASSEGFAPNSGLE